MILMLFEFEFASGNSKQLAISCVNIHTKLQNLVCQIELFERIQRKNTL